MHKQLFIFDYSNMYYVQISNSFWLYFYGGIVLKVIGKQNICMKSVKEKSEFCVNKVPRKAALKKTYIHLERRHDSIKQNHPLRNGMCILQIIKKRESKIL